MEEMTVETSDDNQFNELIQFLKKLKSDGEPD